MNSKTGIAFSTTAIAAVIVLFASGPIVANQQAQAFGFVGFHRGFGFHHFGFFHHPFFFHRHFFHHPFFLHRHFFHHPFFFHRHFY